MHLKIIHGLISSPCEIDFVKYFILCALCITSHIFMYNPLSSIQFRKYNFNFLLVASQSLRERCVHVEGFKVSDFILAFGKVPFFFFFFWNWKAFYNGMTLMHAQRVLLPENFMISFVSKPYMK